MYPYRANLSNSQESFFVMLVDGTMSMNAHYPIFLKCFNNVFSCINHKLTFQFGISSDGSNSVLYDINTFKGHRESNFNKVFQQLFDILLQNHLDKKYLTICFISDGAEPFVYNDFLPLVQQITQEFKIQFASIAVGKDFPTLISNQLREKLHNIGNLDFPSIYKVMDLNEIEWIEDSQQNIVIHPNHEQQITQDFIDAFIKLKQQLIVQTGSIELNEVVYKSFLEIPDQMTTTIQSNQLFLSPNPTVQLRNNQTITCSSKIEDLLQIQRGSMQQLLIHLQANSQIEKSQQEFKKLQNITKKSQQLLIERNQEYSNLNLDLTQKLFPINNLLDQFVSIDYLVSIKNNQTELAELQANLINNPEKCIQKIKLYYQKPKQIQIEPMQIIQQERIVQISQKIQFINEIKLNSKLIILIDSVTISKQQSEEIVKTQKNIFNKLHKDNVQTLWWGGSIQSELSQQISQQQLPLTQAIQQILNNIAQDQSGIKNFTICLILSGQHQVDFQSLKQLQQQIQQQNKLIGFTTLVIENNLLTEDTMKQQQNLLIELRRQLHTNHRQLLVYAKVRTQELLVQLNQYFLMIKQYQSKFYKIEKIEKIGCYIRNTTTQKNAMNSLMQFINDIENCRLQCYQDEEFIQNLKQIKHHYYQIMRNYKEQQILNEQYCLAKLNTIFELIDKVNQKNRFNFLDKIFNIKLGLYNKNQTDFEIEQLTKMRNIMQNTTQSSSWIKKLIPVTQTTLVLGIIYLISKVIKHQIRYHQIK